MIVTSQSAGSRLDSRITATTFALLAILFAPSRADAIPYFAHEYEMTCQTCHSVVPRLTEFGKAFEDHGFAIPGARPRTPLPLAVKINTAYTSEPDATGLPKATLDEIELFLAGRIGSRGNYFIEQYVIDGGRSGATRDAWIAYRATPDDARVAVTLRAGAFTLPLPLDPESFRESRAHYAIFDQRVGTNSFAFFDAKSGLELRVGDVARGASIAVLALGGHDSQSGIASHGIDTMLVARAARGPLALSAYAYFGARPVADGLDRFRRIGYGATYEIGNFEAQGILQTGVDDRIDLTGSPSLSSGGLVQVRYAFTRKLFGSVRYEGTNDTTNGFARDIVPLVGYRLTRNSRLTIEDFITHVPTAKHTLGAQYTVAY